MKRILITTALVALVVSIATAHDTLTFPRITCMSYCCSPATADGSIVEAICLPPQLVDRSAYAPAISAPPEQHDAEVTAACRAAGDPATPEPEAMRLVGRVLILEGGDHRTIAIMRDGKVYLHCVHAWYVAHWVRESR